MKNYIPLLFLFLFFIPVGYAQKKTTKEVEKTSQIDGKPSEETKYFYDSYIELLEDYLKCDSADDLMEYTRNNNTRLIEITNKISEYSSKLTFEQISKIQELAVKIAEKHQSVSVQEENKTSDISSDQLESYLDCLEEKITSRLLSTSLSDLNRAAIEIVRDSCAANVSDYSYAILEDDLDETNEARLDELLLKCEAKVQELIEEKGFDTSPDAIIDEMNRYFDNAVTHIDSRSQFRIHSEYIEFLSKLLVDEKTGTTVMNEKQKDDYLTALFRYSNKNDELKKKQKGQVRILEYKTMNDLIGIAQSFYDKKLKPAKSLIELSEKDREYFLELAKLLEDISGSDFLHMFIDEVRMDILKDLNERYQTVNSK